MSGKEAFNLILEALNKASKNGAFIIEESGLINTAMHVIKRDLDNLEEFKYRDAQKVEAKETTSNHNKSPKQSNNKKK